MSDVIGDDEKGLAHDPSRLRRRILAYRWAFVLAGFPTGIGLLVGMSRGLGHLPMRVSQVVFLASVLSVLALRAADESLIRAYAAGAFDGLRSQGRFSALMQYYWGMYALLITSAVVTGAGMLASTALQARADAIGMALVLLAGAFFSHFLRRLPGT